MKNYLSPSIISAIALSALLTTTLAQENAASDKNILAASNAMRVLAKAEWRELFNGKDLSGWQGDTNGYEVINGVLVCQKGAKNLRTEKEYGDFAFEFEFRLDESANNGIGIRTPGDGHPASSGMEIQILDHNGQRYNAEAEMSNGQKQKMSWLKPWQYHGSIYGVVPAKTGYLKSAGQWNKETIIAIDDHIMVILNGAVIVDAFLDDVTPADGHAHPGMKNKKGHIVLAGHDDRAEFRNLRVSDFAPSPARPVSTVDNQPPVGFEALFNGQNLAGWKGLAHQNAKERRRLSGEPLAQAQTKADEQMREHWSVVDGVLTYDGKGQSLCTSKNFGDFEFYVDWKIPPGADSGIYLRGTPQIQIWDPWDTRTKTGMEPPSDPTEWVAAYRNGRNLGSGGLWNNKRWRNSPTMLADKKPGEWNTFFIRMVGDKVSIWLNEKRVVDRVKLENYWDGSGLVPIPRADQIELQHHGSKLYFKNLYLRELPY